MKARSSLRPKTIEKTPTGSGRMGRPSVGIRELKAQASSVIEEVKRRRITYAVTKRGAVEAFIIPADAGERLLARTDQDSTWNAWQLLVDRLAKESKKKHGSAVRELERTRR